MELLGKAQHSELPNGFEFCFPGDPESFEAVVDFVRLERKCCRFLDFEIASLAGERGIVLRICGDQAARAFLKELLRG